VEAAGEKGEDAHCTAKKADEGSGRGGSSREKAAAIQPEGVGDSVTAKDTAQSIRS
jgi:hypothetical protein